MGDIVGSGADVHRCLAAKALGRIGSPEGVQPLVATLLDEDEDVRTDAAEALLQIADPRSGDQLLDNLIGDPCAEVKLAAIDALAKQGDTRVVPWLQRMVRGRDEEIVWDEEGFIESGWDDWVEIQARSVAALAELNAETAVPDIVAALQDDDAQDISEAAFKALAQLGKSGISALARFLEGEPVRLRRRAATALGASVSPEAAGALAAALADPAPEVRGAALRARAGCFPDDPALSVMFADPDAGIRAETVQLIGEKHPERLRHLLDDKADCVRTATLRTLAALADYWVDDEAIALVRAQIIDESAEVSAAAAYALSVLAPQDALEDLAALLADTGRPVESRLGALKGLALLGTEAAAWALAGVIDDAARPVRLAAMTALARLAGDGSPWPNFAGGTLLWVLRRVCDPDPGADEPGQQAATTQSPSEDLEEAEAEPAPEEVAAQAPTSTLAAILEDAPDTRAARSLPEQGVELSANDMERLAIARSVIGKRRMTVAPEIAVQDDIRRFAARVLGDLDHPDVAEELAAALSAEDAEVRKAAADSLARIGARAGSLARAVADAVIEAMATASSDVKLLLIRALGACEADVTADLLLELLTDADSFVRAEAVRSLSRLGQAHDRIEPLLGDADPSVRMSAAEAIAGATDSRMVKPLVDFAFSFEGYHGSQTAKLLKGLDAAAASSLFVDVLRDPARRRTWSVAIEALAELNCSTSGLQPLPAGGGQHG